MFDLDGSGTINHIVFESESRTCTKKEKETLYKSSFASEAEDSYRLNLLELSTDTSTTTLAKKKTATTIMHKLTTLFFSRNISMIRRLAR